MNFADVRHTSINRVDENGNFLYDKGKTIISKLNSNLDIWQEIYDFMKTRECFLKYYSLLPCSSYHTTIKSHSKCANPLDISYMIKCFNYIPEMYAENIYYHSNFGISLLLKSSKSVYEKFSEFLLNIGSVKPLSPSHMTLGYCYRNIDLTDQEEIYMLSNDISLINDFIINKLADVNYTVSFSSTRLCSFQDMTNFIEL